MSAPEHARPVWLTPKRRERIAKMLTDLRDAGADCTEALQLAIDYEAAPADSMKVAREALRESVGNRRYDAEAVLRALRFPA